MTSPKTEDLAKHIILSLDHELWADAYADAENFKYLGGLWVKVNPIHLVTEGYRIVRDLNELGLKIFADPKFANTAHVLGRTAEAACTFEPDMLNCMASSGEDAMSDFSGACGKDCLAIAVTVLTTISPEECMKMFRRGPKKQVLYFAESAARAGMDGIVCSGHEVKSILKNPITKYLHTVVPGIRNIGDDPGDQSRIMTPFHALESGAKQLVMGSSLRKGILRDNWKRTQDLHEEEWNAFYGPIEF